MSDWCDMPNNRAETCLPIGLKDAQQSGWDMPHDRAETCSTVGLRHAPLSGTRMPHNGEVQCFINGWSARVGRHRQRSCIRASYAPFASSDVSAQVFCAIAVRLPSTARHCNPTSHNGGVGTPHAYRHRPSGAATLRPRSAMPSVYTVI